MNYYEDMAECKKCHKGKCEADNMSQIQNHSRLIKIFIQDDIQLL